MAAETDETQFADTDAGWQARWTAEFNASKKWLGDWKKQGKKIVDRFRDKRSKTDEQEKHWTMFTSNVQTVRSIMFGKTPKVDVARRFSDANDETGRVAGLVLERMLNSDIQRASDGYASALQSSLDDFLLPGLANARVLYVAEFEQKTTPPITAPGPDGQPVERAEAVNEDVKTFEDVETVYVHWQDQLWSTGSKTFGDVRWWAFNNEMSQDKIIERFGEEKGKLVPLNSKRTTSDDDAQKADPWSRADVWEIWDKENKKRWFFVEGMTEILESSDDPYELEGFWPFPRPMFANLTTSELIPTPDFTLAQDLYNEIDTLTTRINLLIDAVRVTGVYDGNERAIEQMLSDSGAQNKIYPVANWAMFGEKGGIRGVVDWFPLEQVVAVLDKLREQRTETIGALAQITGMSDIVRGQAQGAATATEQSIKAKFASVRLQAMQDEFARFASDLQRIRAEIICKMFDARTILERSNIQFTADAQMAPQAIELIKSNFIQYRVEVKPEAVSLTDYAALKQERTEVITAVSGYLQNLGPLAQAQPMLVPMMMEMLRWFVAGLRGSSEIEGVIDQAIQQMKQAAQQPKPPPPPPPPDPKLQTEMFKAKAQQAHTQQELQSDLVRTQAETRVSMQAEAHKAQIRVAESAAKERQKTLAGIDAVVHPAGMEG